MLIQIDLDPRDVWRFQDRAEQLGVRPGDVLRDELAQKRRSGDVRDRIRDAVAEGLCDADIAERTGYTPGHVANTRRGMGLKANPRYPRRTS